MKSFKNGPLRSWTKVKAGEVIAFTSTKPRHVKFEVVANSPVEIWAGSKEDASDFVLVGASDEKIRVEYTAEGTSYAMIKAEKNSAVFVNIPDIDQRVSLEPKDSHVNIEPRVRNNDEFARMMQWVKLNEKRRDEQLAQERAELNRLRSELEQKAREEQSAQYAADVKQWREREAAKGASAADTAPVEAKEDATASEPPTEAV